MRAGVSIPCVSCARRTAHLRPLAASQSGLDCCYQGVRLEWFAQEIHCARLDRLPLNCHLKIAVRVAISGCLKATNRRIDSSCNTTSIRDFLADRMNVLALSNSAARGDLGGHKQSANQRIGAGGRIRHGVRDFTCANAGRPWRMSFRRHPQEWQPACTTSL